MTRITLQERQTWQLIGRIESVVKWTREFDHQIPGVGPSTGDTCKWCAAERNEGRHRSNCPRTEVSRILGGEGCGTVIDYDALDAGIRETVRKLHAAGYDTTDSGDGVSKPTDERVFHQPHVIIVATVTTMVSQAHAVKLLLGHEWDVEASYSTKDGKAWLIGLKAESLKAVSA